MDESRFTDMQDLYRPSMMQDDRQDKQPNGENM